MLVKRHILVTEEIERAWDEEIRRLIAREHRTDDRVRSEIARRVLGFLADKDALAVLRAVHARMLDGDAGDAVLAERLEAVIGRIDPRAEVAAKKARYEAAEARAAGRAPRSAR